MIVNLPQKGQKGFRSIPIRKRFWNKIEKINGCWIWKAQLNDSGYGLVKLDGKMRAAHRVSYELFAGGIPLGMHVLHKCDTPACVKPNHLWIGTHRDNIRDMFAKGRGNPGGRK